MIKNNYKPLYLWVADYIYYGICKPFSFKSLVLFCIAKNVLKFGEHNPSGII